MKYGAIRELEICVSVEADPQMLSSLRRQGSCQVVKERRVSVGFCPRSSVLPNIHLDVYATLHS